MTSLEALDLINTIRSPAELSSLEAVFKKCKDPIKRKELLGVLNAPAYRARIERLQKLQDDVGTLTNNLANRNIATIDKHLIGTAETANMRTIFDLQQGTGLAFSFDAVPKAKVEQILKNPWIGEHYSARIWGNTQELAKVLKEELLTGILTGKAGWKVSDAISSRMAVGSMEARRLVRTESNYVANQSELESYKECGVEKYEFLATLDLRTSDICAAKDGLIVDIDKAVPGENVPPLHPWCRSTTIAVFDDSTVKGLERRARNPITGKNELVPADMTYPEWLKGQKGEKSPRVKRYDDPSTKADWVTIDSPEYRKKFEGIIGNVEVEKTLYSVSRMSIQHREGTLLEDIYFIEAKSGKILASQTKSKSEHGVTYSSKIYKALEEAKKTGTKIIALHNHPEGYPPSARDFNKALENGYEKGVTVGHNGEVYVYQGPQTKIDEDLFHRNVDRFSELGHTIDGAFLKANEIAGVKAERR